VKLYGPPARVSTNRDGQVTAAFWTIPEKLVGFRRPPKTRLGQSAGPGAGREPPETRPSFPENPLKLPRFGEPIRRGLGGGEGLGPGGNNCGNFNGENPGPLAAGGERRPQRGKGGTDPMGRSGRGRGNVRRERQAAPAQRSRFSPLKKGAGPRLPPPREIRRGDDGGRAPQEQGDGRPGRPSPPLHPQTVRNYLKRYPALAEVVADERDLIVDTAELKLSEPCAGRAVGCLLHAEVPGEGPGLRRAPGADGGRAGSRWRPAADRSSSWRGHGGLHRAVAAGAGAGYGVDGLGILRRLSHPYRRKDSSTQ